MKTLHEARKSLSQGMSIFDIKLRVVYYARVSTDKDAQINSIHNQIAYYEEFIKKQKNWTFVGGYVDEGISGTSVNKREDFLRMIEDAKLKKFDFIVTKEISRFSRNTLDSIKYTQELLENGVGVLFETDNINTLQPDSELRLTIMSSIAQDEVRKISTRVKFGFQRAIEKGVVLGNSRIWGYKKDKGKLVIVEEEAEMIKKIFDMYAHQGLGIRAILKRLTEEGYKNSNGREFTFNSVRGILVNPKYKGYYCGNKTTKPDFKIKKFIRLDESEWKIEKDEEHVPPIVSEETWERANRILRERSEKQKSDTPTSYQNKYTYSGKIICGEHNAPYYRALYRYPSGNKEIWECKLYFEKGKSACSNPKVYTTELDEVMRLAINDIVINKEVITEELIEVYKKTLEKSDVKKDIAKYQVLINKLKERKDKLLDYSIEGRITDDEFQVRNDKANSEIEEANKRIEELQAEDAKSKEILTSINGLKKLIFEELEFKDKVDSDIIEAILEKIEVYKTDKENEVNLKVYIRALKETKEFSLIRHRGIRTSVCPISYT